MSDINGADLDRYITGNYGDQGPEGDQWSCEVCGENEDRVKPDESEPTLCSGCAENLTGF